MGLDKIRQEIDEIDIQMKELFLKRMDLSGQVAEEKKKTGGAVYVPHREKEMIENRSKDVESEKLPEYQAFIKQVIGISRTYQYSKLQENAEKLKNLAMKETSLTLEFCCEKDSKQIAVNLDALLLAGLTIEKITANQEDAGRLKYQIHVSGDFTKPLARGAIMQVLEENKI